MEENNVNIEENRPMDIIEAISLLDPMTQEASLATVPEEKRNDALVEAAFLLVAAGRKQIILKAINGTVGVWRCPVCGKIFYAPQNFCSQCGQALDFDGHSKQIIETVKKEIILPG